jgi:DNA repair protein RecO (recombination protein O)
VLSQNLISTSAKNNDLKTVTDVTSNYLYISLYTNIFKSSIAMFLSEVLTSSIKEEHQNISLFEFLETAFTYLDLSDHFANFHLFFLVKLTKFLGFYPDFSNESADSFNLRTGKFELNLQDNYVIEGESAFFMKAFLKSDFESYGLVKMNSKQRNDFLNNLLLYFELHLIDFRHPKSLEVLNTLFS